MGSDEREGRCEYEAGKGCSRFAMTCVFKEAHSLCLEGELVRWSTDGSLFVIQTLSTLDLYTTVRSLLVVSRS